MELRVFNKELEPLGVVDEYGSLIWTVKYFDVGTFSMQAPITKNNCKLLTNGNILVKHDNKNDVTDENGDKWRRAAEIKYVQISTNEQGEEVLEVQGCMLGKWLSKRVVTPQIVLNTTEQNIINTLVNKNCGSYASQKRKFEQFIILSQDNFGGSNVEYSNELYVDLGQEVKDQAQAGKLGYDILVNERQRLYGFYLYKGRDLTSTNTSDNTPCIFSRDFDNVNEQAYECSTENIKNFIYVQGAALEDETNQPLVTYDSESKAGLDLQETYCDASDISRSYENDNGEKVTIALKDYNSLLQTRANTELSSYIESINFSSSINTRSKLKYKTDFNLGDRVSCIEKRWNIKLDARITEVVETYQKGEESLEITFGESTPTLIDKIRKVR